MNKTYIKNKGTTTFISSIPGNECNGNDNYNKVDWNIDYDGNRANIEMDINSNGRMKHVNYELTNDDLEDMLNVPAFKMPIEDRLLSDFPLIEKDAIILPLMSDELILPPRKNKLFKPTKNLIRLSDSHSSWSITDKEINPSPEGADLNIQRFNSKKNNLPEYEYSDLTMPLRIKNVNSNERIKTKTIKRRKPRKRLDYSLKNKLKTPSVKTKRVFLKSKKPNSSLFNF